MTASPVSEMPNSGSYAGRSHAEYQRAQAHSRLVRVLKILLPLAAAFTVVAFVIVSWLDNLVPEGVGIESVVIKDGKLVMQSPVMSGQGPGARLDRPGDHGAQAAKTCPARRMLPAANAGVEDYVDSAQQIASLIKVPTSP